MLWVPLQRGGTRSKRGVRRAGQKGGHSSGNTACESRAAPHPCLEKHQRVLLVTPTPRPGPLPYPLTPLLRAAPSPQHNMVPAASVD